MKKKISDLMDVYTVVERFSFSDTPLSSERIKEETMKKLSAETIHHTRSVARTLLIAAMIAVFSVSAIAATVITGAGDYFKDFFSKDGTALASGQIESINTIGNTFFSGVTDNGSTITPLAAIADENLFYLRVLVEAPEGTILKTLDENTDGYYQFFGSEADEDMTLTIEDNKNASFGWSPTFTYLADADNSDNKMEAVIRLNRYEFQESDLVFNDGKSKILTIPGLWIQSPDKIYTPVFKGTFSFDIGKNFNSSKIEKTGLSVSCTSPDFGHTNRLTFVKLSPLSFSYTFMSNMVPNDWIEPGLGHVKIILKDGTTFYDNMAGITPGISASKKELLNLIFGTEDASLTSTTETEFREYITFDEPLDLTLVSHIVYGENRISLTDE